MTRCGWRTPAKAHGRTRCHDASTGIWYCYAQGTWHYSIDTCQSWVDVNMLEIRVVEGAGTVDTFGAQMWTHTNGALLQFFDTRYAQSGWHNMTEFVVDLYDGKGYDGQPLKVLEVAVTDEESSTVVCLNNLTPTAFSPQEPSPEATIKEWLFYVYGQWNEHLTASWWIPNPSLGYRPETYTKPIEIIAQSTDSGGKYHDYNVGKAAHDVICGTAGKDTVFLRYAYNGYSLRSLVRDVSIIHYYYNTSPMGDQVEIQDLAIVDHANVGLFTVGSTTVTPDNLCLRFGESRYEEVFRELNEYMVDGGQIHHYGCEIAGASPMHPYADQNNLSKRGTWEGKSYAVRQMLGTIANLTNTVVFASSDGQWRSANYDTGIGRWVVSDAKMCLEFGVNQQGRSVSYRDCEANQDRIWNLALWTPASGGKIVPLPDARFDHSYPQAVPTTEGVDTRGEPYVNDLYGFLPYYRPR